MEDFFKVSAFGCFVCVLLALAFTMTEKEIKETHPDDIEGAAGMKRLARYFWVGFVLLLVLAIVLQNIM